MKSQRIQGFCEGGYLPAETWRMREGSQAGRVCAIQPSGAYSRKTSLCDPRGKSLTPRRGQGERWEWPRHRNGKAGKMRWRGILFLRKEFFLGVFTRKIYASSKPGKGTFFCQKPENKYCRLWGPQSLVWKCKRPLDSQAAAGLGARLGLLAPDLTDWYVSIYGK